MRSSARICCRSVNNWISNRKPRSDLDTPLIIHESTAPAVLAVFALTYVGLAVGHVPGLKLNRTGIALLGAIATTIVSGLPSTAAIGLINWPTMLLLFGFFVLSSQLRLSGFFDKVANDLSSRLDNPASFLFILMLVIAGLSAFLNHDIVCFVFTPIVGVTLLRRRLNPVPFLIALAIASNIGAAATLVGNPQDMMIAQLAKLNFGSYLLWCITPVIFALGCAYGIIWLMSRKQFVLTETRQTDSLPVLQPFDRFHTIKGLVILVLVVAFFFTSIPKELVALTAAGIHFASTKFRTEDLFKLVDWPILVLFMSLFIVNGVFQNTGFGHEAVQWLQTGGLNLQTPSILAVVTALLSNLVNNSAAVLLLVKVVHISDPQTAYILALANSFGGSLIIVGSVSNIIVVLQAREMGINISFGKFARLGIPVTLVALGGLLGWVAMVG